MFLNPPLQADPVNRTFLLGTIRTLSLGADRRSGVLDRVAQSAKLYSAGFRKTWGVWCEPNAEPSRRAGVGRKWTPAGPLSYASRRAVSSPRLPSCTTCCFTSASGHSPTLPQASKSTKSVATRWAGRRISTPNEDNIVRVQVSNLRKKLEEYFATDGKDEPMRITVPKGAYVPRLEPNVVAATPAAAPVRFPWILLLWVSTGLLAISCLYLVALRSPAPHNAPQATTPQTPPTIHFGPGFSAAVSQRRWWLPIPVWSCFRTSSTRTFPWPTISAIGTRKNSSTR